MSTGVDSQQPFNIPIESLGARQRSVSQSHGSLLPHSIHLPDQKSANMVSQSQRSRWLKTGAIVGFIFMVLLWLSPSKSSSYADLSGGM
jgi:guanosine-diphosphatase